MEIKDEPKKPPILLVEDEDTLRQVIHDHLKKSGFSVTQVNDGSAALKFLKRNGAEKYLLITDLKMKEMNGERLILEAMKSGIEFAGIIIATGEIYVGMETKKVISGQKAKLVHKPYSGPCPRVS